MELLQQLTEQAKRLPLSAFSERFEGIYLIGRISDNQAMGFATRVGTPSHIELLKAIKDGQEKIQNETLLLRVEKSDRNSWKSRISVGRATNNDLIVRHASVSKLHAHFLVQAENRAGLRFEQLVLADAGSANGTLVNGRTLEEGEDRSVQVNVGDRILFGEVECELLDAATLHRRLRRLAVHSDF